MINQPPRPESVADGDQDPRPMPSLESAGHCRAYAGFLRADNLPEKAAVYYRRAMQMYASGGHVLEALAVGQALWQLETTGAEDILSLRTGMEGIDNGVHPLIRFLSRLDEKEMSALVSHLISEKLPASHTIVKPGDVFDHFCMIASGTVKDSLFMSVEDVQSVYRSPTIELKANDYFGNVYPFEKQTASRSYIETLSTAEILKISKESLAKICGRFPNFEVGLLELLNIRKTSANSDPRSLRRTRRLKLGVELDMMIEMASRVEKPVQLKGYTQDVSVDGICTVLDNDSGETMRSRQLLDRAVGKTIKIAAGLNHMKVFFSGKIAWWKFVSHNGRKKVAFGIKLNLLPPNYKGLLVSFLSLLRSETDKNRIAALAADD